ncbi:MAG: hypothetical protein ACKOE2_06120, partial [Actinomycetales bacterium]
AVAPEPPFARADYFAAIGAAVAPEGTQVRWVPSAWLAEHGVTPAQLPLWSGSDDPDWVFALDPARLSALGFEHEQHVIRQWNA